MTKDKILDVAVDLFSEFGYDGVSIRQIAGEVGIRESSIYNHYPNKESILKAVLDAYIEEMMSDDIPLKQADLNLDMGFDYFYKIGCDAYLSKLKNDRMMKITRLLFIESYHNDEIRKFLKKAIIEAPVNAWFELFRLMKSKNIIDNDCDEVQLAESFFYYGMFLLYEHFIVNYPESDAEFLEAFKIKTEMHAKIIFNSVKANDFEIRLERESDYEEVENLVRNSFWNVYRPGAYEHFIVHQLRNDESFIRKLAFVIEKDNLIIGHINYSRGKLICENSCQDAVVLGPVAIDKDYQNHGYGSQLINHTLKIAENGSIPFVFVVGDENYYSRFGFESASKYNIYLEGTDFNEENPFFMIKVFDVQKITCKRSVFKNPDVFDVDESEVDEFDEKFEYREKLIKEGQLGV